MGTKYIKHNYLNQESFIINRPLVDENNRLHPDFFSITKLFNNRYNQYTQTKSIFNENDYPNYDERAKEIIDKILNKKNFLDLQNKESRAIACLIASAVGDAMGLHTEFRKIDYENKSVKSFEDLGKIKHLKTTFNLGEISDDTSMALCLADSLVFNQYKFNASDLRVRFFLWWHFGYNNCREDNSSGLGGNISESLRSTYDEVNHDKIILEKFSPKDQNNQRNGNGSLMRLAPLAILYSNQGNNKKLDKNLIECLKYSKLQSLTTHNGKEAYECCMVLSYLMIQNINSQDNYDSKIFLDSNMSLEKFKKYIEKDFQPLDYSIEMLIESKKEEESKFQEMIKKGKYMKNFNKTVNDRDWNWKNPNFRYSETRSKQLPTYIGSYCLDALAMALHVVYFSSSLTEVFLKIVNMGGDADTVASIAGQIGGSIWGLDKELIELYDYVRKYDNDKCAIMGYLLFNSDIKR